MNCPDCGAPVELKVHRAPGDRRRYPPYLVDADGSGMRRHFCAPPEPELVQWDRCDCGAVYGRVNGGPRLDMRTWELHICPASKPTPTDPVRIPSTNGHVSVEPPLSKPWRVIP